ncbi:DNA base-flipping protein [Andreprevotia sp. IGB-42]|uniref:MGMT family protein n=1 Tax=Andreprevotia sp. IGB-42 TaxID=2497473 RepID=UPI001358EAC3|nr:MGMT family protein [Andreprevotia sp. IGB-42]KAF0813734.1 DNA base-flipping protein [Andreprevotia sp. IGB-42]
MPVDTRTMHAAMLAIVAQIPHGQVLSYGEVARLAGFPRHARMVGRVLAQTNLDVPWHRVVNSKGQISRRGLDGGDDLQRVLLEAEGVTFSGERIVDRRHPDKTRSSLD